MLASLHVLRPPPPQTTSVVVARTDLVAGSTVHSGDLARRDLPAAAVPDGSVRTTEGVVGRTLSGPMRTGEVVTDYRLVRPGLLAGYPPGSALSTIRVTDAATLTGVRVGDVVDVVGADPAARTPPRVVARSAAVVSLPHRDDDEDLSREDRSGAVVTVAVPESAALALAGAAVSARISLLPVG